MKRAPGTGRPTGPQQSGAAVAGARSRPSGAAAAGFQELIPTGGRAGPAAQVPRRAGWGLPASEQGRSFASGPLHGIQRLAGLGFLPQAEWERVGSLQGVCPGFPSMARCTANEGRLPSLSAVRTTAGVRPAPGKASSPSAVDRAGAAAYLSACLGLQYRASAQSSCGVAAAHRSLRAAQGRWQG